MTFSTKATSGNVLINLQKQNMIGIFIKEKMITKRNHLNQENR